MLSSLMPISSMIAVPPTTQARSCRSSLRRSPKPGALTAQTLSTPRSLFTTRVASASPSTSSATMSRLLPLSAILPRIGSSSFALEIFFSNMRT